MMLRSLTVALLLAPALCTAQQKNLREKITKAADKIESKVIEWRRDIHEHPELGNRETRTAGIIAAHLTSLGIEVKTGVAITGVVGILKGGKPGPVVALRADMDALPVTEATDLPFASKIKATYNGNEVGVMHACGHDSHVAMLMGVAEILSGLKSELNGTIKFFFQPAEEGAPEGEEGGAELMIREGVMENPKVDAVFGLHIQSDLEVGSISVRPGGTMAGVNDMKITVTGKSAHGAYPWLSADPIVASAEIINALQTVVSRNLKLTENAGVVTIGAINGGNRTNIIPEKVEMLGTIRSFSKRDEAMMLERVRTIVTKTAEAAGVHVELKLPYTSHYPVTYNDPALTKQMMPSLIATAGSDKIVERPPATGAEDFSFFEQEAPGIFFFLGGMPKGGDPATAPPHHTPKFFIDESGFKLGMKAMANIAVDYLQLHSAAKK